MVGCKKSVSWSTNNKIVVRVKKSSKNSAVVTGKNIGTAKVTAKVKGKPKTSENEVSETEEPREETGNEDAEMEEPKEYTEEESAKFYEADSSDLFPKWGWGQRIPENHVIYRYCS